MKSFRLMMMAGMMAIASAASAQVKVLTADPVTFEADAEEAELVVNIDYETTENVVAWGFSFYLPEGVAPINYYDEDEEDFVWKGEVGSTTNAKKVVNKGLSIQQKSDGGWLCVGYADGNPKMKSTHGMLVTITLNTSAQVVGDGKISAISVSNDLSQSLDQGNIDEVMFAVDASQAKITTGINDIKSVNTNAPAYNLQGMRVNGQAKGLLIRDGKKLIVK